MVGLGEAENRLLQTIGGLGVGVVFRHWHASRSDQMIVIVHWIRDQG